MRSFGYVKVKPRELKSVALELLLTMGAFRLRWIQVSLQCGEGRSLDVTGLLKKIFFST